MDNAQKAIMIGVALLITISVIAAVMLVTGIGTDMMNSSNQRLEGVSSNIASQLLADYDVKEMTGASVIASVKKFYDKKNFLLCVDTSKGGCLSSNQNYYSTLAPIGDIMLEPSSDGIDYDHGWFSVDRLANYHMFIFSGTLQDNTPNITGLSSKIGATDKYMSYIIYQVGTDTILGIYFKKIS